MFTNPKNVIFTLRDTLIYNQLAKNLGNTPTDDQSEALKRLSKFIVENNNDVIFLMTGYAGTGKTKNNH